MSRKIVRILSVILFMSAVVLVGATYAGYAPWKATEAENWAMAHAWFLLVGVGIWLAASAWSLPMFDPGEPVDVSRLIAAAKPTAAKQ